MFHHLLALFMELAVSERGYLQPPGSLPQMFPLSTQQLLHHLMHFISSIWTPERPGLMLFIFVMIGQPEAMGAFTNTRWWGVIGLRMETLQAPPVYVALLPKKVVTLMR